MKLVVCITYFDGGELLGDCVANYKKFCDDIVICYQEVSYTGKHKPNILEELEKYRDQATLVEYKTDLSLSPKENEMLKHTLMVKEAEKFGGTHCLLSAVDHFYDVDEFNKVKEKASQYDVTFTDVHTYYKKPEWQISPKAPWKAPFIFKIYPHTEVTRVPNYPLFVDPANKINTIDTWHLFDESEIVLHNYAIVRNDLKEKMNNAAALPLLWSTKKKKEIINQFDSAEEPPERVLYYNHAPGGVTIKKVPNYFNL